MFVKLIKSLLASLSPVSVPKAVMGTRPGYVWWNEGECWVEEAETYKPGPGTYAMLGPVYAGSHGHP